MNAMIFKAEEALQAYLQEGCYTFIGPENQDLLGNFISFINNACSEDETLALNPKLLDKKIVKQALSFLPAGEKLAVYVVEGSLPYGIVYTTASEYCSKLGISLSISLVN